MARSKPIASSCQIDIINVVDQRKDCFKNRKLETYQALRFFIMCALKHQKQEKGDYDLIKCTILNARRHQVTMEVSFQRCMQKIIQGFQCMWH
jgi:hypothetical protein